MKIVKIKDNELEEAIVMLDKNTKLTEVLVEYPDLLKIFKPYTFDYLTNHFVPSDGEAETQFLYGRMNAIEDTILDMLLLEDETYKD